MYVVFFFCNSGMNENITYRWLLCTYWKTCQEICSRKENEVLRYNQFVTLCYGFVAWLLRNIKSVQTYESLNLTLMEVFLSLKHQAKTKKCPKRKLIR